MAKDVINFSILELIHEDRRPTIENLKSTIPERGYYEPDNSYVYSIHSEIIQGYFWMSIEYGAAQPRPPFLIDRSQGNELVENKRTDHQVEPSRQLFCIYDQEAGNIYVSDARKKVFIQELFNHFGKSFNVKRVYVDAEEFLRTLKIVDKMAIAARTDLISFSGDLMRPIQDIFGYDAPEKFYISADYGSSITDAIRKQFRFFNGECKEGKLQKFICVGKNEQGLETVFNTDNFTQKILAEVEKQENGLYDALDVRNEIVRQLSKLRI